jgi:UDP-N-acetylglucosamine diphosphorylase/glucosamine-1-phosphate N-acetyltransferase
MNLTVILLAAGLGTRMKSKKAKVLHRAGGRTLVAHVVRAALGVAAAENIVVVTGHQAEAVEDELRPFGVRFVRQLQQKGTGHAVECTRELLESGEGLVMVLYGDTPLLSTRTLRLLVETHRKSQAGATLISTTLENPHGYGRIVRDEDGLVSQIVEHKVATPEQLLIPEINSGIYCFQAELLWRHLGEVRPDNPAREFYLTDMAAILRRRGFSVAPLHVADSRELLGINTRVELADVDRILRDRKNSELMLAGVTIERPETVVIDPDVRIGMDSVSPSSARIAASAPGPRWKIPFWPTAQKSSRCPSWPTPASIREPKSDRSRASEWILTSAPMRESVTSWNSRRPNSALGLRASTWLTWAIPRSARAPTSAPAPSPATSTASPSTKPKSAKEHSSVPMQRWSRP